MGKRLQYRGAMADVVVMCGSGVADQLYGVLVA